MSSVHSGLLIDRLLVELVGGLQRGCLQYTTVVAVLSLVILAAALEATPFLVPLIYLIL